VQIDIAVFDGVDELDVLGPLEVFRAAEASGADLDVRVVTRADPPHELRGGFGLRFQPDATYVPGADVLVVPGGGWVNRADVGAWGEAHRGDWPALIRAAAATGTLLAGVCTGALLLAHAGVLTGRRAATHHAALDDLAEFDVTVVRQRVVDDGDIVTSGGVTSGIDLALHLLARLVSAEVAAAGARRMEWPFEPVIGSATERRA
jgi:transcriptional regulator GlxA family with amidase domain